MENKTLSLILLSYYSGERLRKVYEDVTKVFGEENIPIELLIMDDGSKDNSFAIACELEKQHPDVVRAYQLSRNFGSVYSHLAGQSICTGACAMSIPDDEQMPYDAIVRMYRLWEEGHKIIIPYRDKRDDPKWSKLMSNTYYSIMNKVSEIQYPKGGADGAFLDREVIDIMNERIHPRNTMFIAEVLNLGFSPYFMPYERPLGLGKGKSRWTFRKKLKLAKDSLFAASTFPVRCISTLGMLSCLISVPTFVFYFYVAAFGNRHFWGMNIPGWFSIILLILLFGGLILVALGVVAEYLWRIYDEVKDKPGYIIKKK